MNSCLRLTYSPTCVRIFIFDLQSCIFDSERSYLYSHLQLMPGSGFHQLYVLLFNEYYFGGIHFGGPKPGPNWNLPSFLPNANWDFISWAASTLSVNTNNLFCATTFLVRNDADVVSIPDSEYSCDITPSLAANGLIAIFGNMTTVSVCQPYPSSVPQASTVQPLVLRYASADPLGNYTVIMVDRDNSTAVNPIFSPGCLWEMSDIPGSALLAPLSSNQFSDVSLENFVWLHASAGQICVSIYIDLLEHQPIRLLDSSLLSIGPFLVLAGIATSCFSTSSSKCGRSGSTSWKLGLAFVFSQWQLGLCHLGCCEQSDQSGHNVLHHRKLGRCI